MYYNALTQGKVKPICRTYSECFFYVTDLSSFSHFHFFNLLPMIMAENNTTGLAGVRARFLEAKPRLMSYLPYSSLSSPSPLDLQFHIPSLASKLDVSVTDDSDPELVCIKLRRRLIRHTDQPLTVLDNSSVLRVLEYCNDLTETKSRLEATLENRERECSRLRREYQRSFDERFESGHCSGCLCRPNATVACEQHVVHPCFLLNLVNPFSSHPTFTAPVLQAG